jgi:hypothetical protein
LREILIQVRELDRFDIIKEKLLEYKLNRFTSRMISMTPVSFANPHDNAMPLQYFKYRLRYDYFIPEIKDQRDQASVNAETSNALNRLCDNTRIVIILRILQTITACDSASSDLSSLRSKDCEDL